MALLVSKNTGWIRDNVFVSFSLLQTPYSKREAGKLMFKLLTKCDYSHHKTQRDSCIQTDANEPKNSKHFASISCLSRKILQSNLKA